MFGEWRTSKGTYEVSVGAGYHIVVHADSEEDAARAAMAQGYLAYSVTCTHFDEDED